DRVLRAPEHEGRHGQLADARRHPVELRGARVVGIGRDVRDEPADPPAALGARVRRPIAGLDHLAERGTGQCERGLENAGERSVAVACTPGCSASRRGAGTGAPPRSTAVLSSTTPASRSGWSTAQPSEITPPQSWPIVTTGPVSPRASVRS